MFSSARVTLSPSTTTRRAPSPSTRASEFTVNRLLRWLISPPFRERRCGRGECGEHPIDIVVGHAVDAQDRKQRTDIGAGHRPEASETAAVIRRAQGAAAGLGDRAQAG